MILKSNLKVKEPLKIAMQDIRLASYILEVPAGELNALLSFVEEISDRKAQSLMKVKSIVSFDRYYQLFEDRTFTLNTPRRDWVLIGLIYIIHNADINLVQSSIKDFLTFVKSWVTSREAVIHKQRELASIQRDIYNLFDIKMYSFFNLQRLKKLGEERNIKIYTIEETLIMEWVDITLTSVKQESLHYSKIILFFRIPDFYVSRYVIFSGKFYYDSNWKVNVLLHPNLNDAGILEYGRNNFLEFIPQKRYDMVLDIFNEIILCKSDFTFSHLSYCLETYSKLAVFWESIDINLSIEEKSKELFGKLKEVG